MGRVLVVEDGFHVGHHSPGHPERPDRVEAIRAHLANDEATSRLPRTGAAAIDDDALLRVHSAAHLQRVAAVAARGGGHLDPDTYATAASDLAARIAAGGAVAAVDAVLDGGFDHAFAVVRPPGHHATTSQALGFCLYNNVAVAVRHAQVVRGAGRVAIVDIDVHHGNGSEGTFWNDPSVLYSSLHQAPFYPGTGAIDDRGGPQAAGLTVNVPLAAGTSAGAWLAAFDDHVLPSLRAFEPELIVVSCGFDAHRDDPLAELLLDTATYASVAERLVDLRSLGPHPPTAWVLEGGYDLEALTGSTSAVLEVLIRG